MPSVKREVDVGQGMAGVDDGEEPPVPIPTQKLSSLVPKIVGWKRPVKIGRCRLLLKASSPRAERKARFVGLLY